MSWIGDLKLELGMLLLTGTGKAACPKCDPKIFFNLNDMEADHINPWSKGGKTTVDNC